MLDMTWGYICFLEPHWWFEHKSINDILESSQSECRVCRFLEWLFSLSSIAQRAGDYVGAKLVWRSDEDKRGLVLSLSLPVISSVQIRNSKRTHTFRLMPAETDGMWSLACIPMNVQVTQQLDVEARDTRESFDLARKWLSECLRCHDCGSTTSGRFPSRVLYVGNEGSSRVTLKITRSDDSGQYAALSYCWGVSNNFTTSHTYYPILPFCLQY